jgi:hypothetical protein
MEAGCAGFSMKFVMRSDASVVTTPNWQARSIGTSTTPTVMSAALTSWAAIIGP